MRLGLAPRFVLTVAVFLIPAGVWIGYVVDVERDQVDRQVEDRLVVRLAAISGAIEQDLGRGRGVLEVLAGTPDARGNATVCAAALSTFNETHPRYIAFARTDPDGRVDCSSTPLDPFDATGLGFYRVAVERGAFGVGHLPTGLLTETPGVALVLPLEEGALIAVVPEGDFLPIGPGMADPGGDADVVVMVVSHDIVIALSDASDRFVGARISDHAVLSARGDPGRIYPATGLRGVERLFMSQTLEVAEGSPAQIIIGTDAEAAYAPVIEDAMERAGFAIVLILLIALAVTVALTRVVLRPVRHIADVAEQIRTGRTSTRIDPAVAGRQDEIGTLATAFNASTGRIMDQVGELERANLRLDELDRIKTGIIDSIAHELRTPVLIIDAQVDRMKGFLDDTDGHDALASLDMTDRNVKRLRRLVEGVVKVANLRAGRTGLDMGPVSVGHVLAGIGQRWAPTVDEHDIRLVVAAGEGWVEADPAALDEVLDEVLDNAVKFTPPGGSVTLDVETGPDTITLFCQDTGVGLDRRKAPPLEPFEPHGDPIRGGRIGAGLGLFIARSLLVKMGGSLTIESPGPGEGATVTICLGRA